MNEIIKKYVSMFPWFFNRYLAIVSNPAKFATSKTLPSPANTKDSLKFFAGTFLVTMIIGFSVIENNVELARDLLIQLAILTPLAGLLTLAWKIVRVNASFKPMLLLLMYFFGAFLPVFPIAMFLMKGMQKTYGVHGLWAWGFIILFIMTVWAVACWNAYRAYFKASIFQALLAGGISIVFTIIVFNFAKLILTGIPA